MIVVSDSSPIVALARIGRLELLPRLYQRVLIPKAVDLELARSHRLRPLNPESWPWLTVKRVTDLTRVQRLRHLDSGEAEAIILAVEMNADLLLIDERKGRRAAMERGLHVVGLVGVLAEAKRQGLIPLVRPVLDELTEQAGFWLDPGLSARFLFELGEAQD